jgi:hypothetical protein
VQRVPPNFFKGCIFVILLTDDDEISLVERIVETYGGSIRPSVTKRTKYVIANQDSYSTNQVEWDKAEGQETPILSTEWIAECLRQKKLVDPDADWEVEKPSDDSAPAPAPAASSSSSSGGVKRKAPMDDDDADKTSIVAPPPAKKAKTASSTASSSSAAAAPAPAPAPLHAALKSKTSWMGVCAYDSQGGKYPFTLNLDNIAGNQISGTIEWPTLNGAKTKFRGTASGTQLVFEEYEIITGEDDVEVPNSYKGTLDASSGETINGTVNESSPDQAGKWSVTYVEKDDEDDAMDTDPAEHLIAGVMKPNQKYTGVVIQEHPFEITIESRTGNKIEGTIFWKLLKCSTKFRGNIDPDTEELSIEEYQIAKLAADGVEPELPMMYKAAVSPDLENLEGNWGSDISKPEGTFKIKL